MVKDKMVCHQLKRLRNNKIRTFFPVTLTYKTLGKYKKEVRATNDDVTSSGINTNQH